MSRYIKLTSSICLALITLLPLQSEAATQNSVSIVFESSNNLFVPSNLVWGSKSIVAANKAIAFQKAEIDSAITELSIKGAVRLRKRYVDTENLHFPDWTTYIPKFGQYVLQGLNSEGVLVGESQSLPSNHINLPTYLVSVSPDDCYLAGAGMRQPSCRVSLPKPEIYLRAQLRTDLEHDMLADNLYWIKQQLEYCLSSGQKFSIRGNILTCPMNQKQFFTRSIKLKDKFLTRSYTIKIQASKRTAVIYVSKRDFREVAKTGRFQGTDVIAFG